jgi:hypothetical protein
MFINTSCKISFAFCSSKYAWSGLSETREERCSTNFIFFSSSFSICDTPMALRSISWDAGPPIRFRYADIVTHQYFHVGRTHDLLCSGFECFTHLSIHDVSHRVQGHDEFLVPIMRETAIS